MPEWLSKFVEKLGDILNSVLSWLDKLSQKLKDKTGVSINFTAIIGIILIAIFLTLIIKGILGWVGSSLKGN